MKTAFILAAGRGERLRPFSNHQPKALCPLHGKPVIEHHVVRLAKAGFTRIVINHAYLGGQIRQHLGEGAQWQVEILYSPEPPGALETGGGIVNALPLLGTRPFLTLNADIYTDFDFSQCRLTGENQAHLILVPQHARLHASSDFGLLDGKLRNTHKQYIFAGIAVYHPLCFAHCLPGRYPLSPLLRRLAAQRLASGEVYQGRWFDIGSPERLQAAQDN